MDSMKLIYLLVALTLLTTTVQANSITTLQLRNRPAEEVIPIVKPLLGAGESISGRGFKVFLRASPQTLAEVRDVIDALDVAARTLQISVFQGDTRGLEALGFDANIRVETGDGSVSVGTDRDKSSDRGGSVTYRSNGSSGSVNTTSTQMRLQDNPIHQIRVTDGNEAFIETGDQIPYFSGLDWVAPGRVVGGVEYKDVVTGFYVRPRTNGDQVTLQVSPFKNSVDGARGGIATQSASTQLTGRIGEWLLLGGVTEQLKRSQGGIASYHSTQSRSNSSIWIRTDLVQ